MFNLKVMSDAWPQLLAAIPVTLQLTGSALLLGLILALIIALMRLSSHAVLRLPSLVFVDIFRSTPLLVQFFLIYYGSGQFRPELQDVGLWTFFREPWFCAVLTLMLNTAAYTSEIIRGGIQSVGHGQIEAGRACGMSTFLLFRRIILPQAARQALPAYGNEIILMVKSSSLASTITILEITGVAKKIISANVRLPDRRDHLSHHQLHCCHRCSDAGGPAVAATSSKSPQPVQSFPEFLRLSRTTTRKALKDR
mgnify:CR=1 FL=1